ncbi:MAG: hypothetical protein Alpg2KO_29700 [Alphaproteobacteria bacterium]
MRLSDRQPFRQIFRSFGSWLRHQAAPGAVLLATLGTGTPVFAQQAQAEADEPEQDAVTFVFENDTWGTTSDRWYTSGQRLILDRDPDKRDFASAGLDALGFDNPDRRILSLNQQIYTPEGIGHDQHADGSHPWAGWLGITAGAAKERTSGAVDSIELSVGLTGPYSYAEEAQSAVHRVFDGVEPQGWHKQLKTEPTFNVTVGRHWPGLGHLDLGSDVQFKASPYVLGALGTWDRSATAGALLSIGSTNDVTTARPDQAVQGRGVLGLNNSGGGDFGWSVYAGGELRAVEWNGAISGNSFQSSPSADLKNMVEEHYAGVELRYRGTSFRAEGVKRSKEFDDQSENHRYLRLSVSRRF